MWNPVFEVEHYIEGQHNGGVFNSKNLNSYGYCYSNPVRYLDPNGKQVDPNDHPPIVAVIVGTIKVGILNLSGLAAKYAPTEKGLLMRTVGMSYHFSLREDPESELGMSIFKEIRFDQTPLKDAGTAAESTLDLAPLKPSANGVATFAKVPVNLISAITRQFDNLECMDCAKAVVTALKQEGINGQILDIITPKKTGMQANIWSDTAAAARNGDGMISTNGRHRAVLVEGKVYDNIHQNGVSYDDWIKDINAPGGYKVEKTDF